MVLSLHSPKKMPESFTICSLSFHSTKASTTGSLCSITAGWTLGCQELGLRRKLLIPVPTRTNAGSLGTGD